MTLDKMAASMPTTEIWTYVEMVPNSNFVHRARSSQVNMLCISGQKGWFCETGPFVYRHFFGHIVLEVNYTRWKKCGVPRKNVNHSLTPKSLATYSYVQAP